jgi:hypothetical protein
MHCHFLSLLDLKQNYYEKQESQGIAMFCLFVCLMVFSANFNNISVLLVEETEGPRENHRPVASH